MADETTTTTTDPPATKTPNPAIVAARAKLAEGVAAYKAADAKRASDAEATRQSQLTEAQKLAEARQALVADSDKTRAELAAERKGLADSRRKDAAERLGIFPKAMALVPDVDPATPEGASALEKWARENPEFVKQKPAGAPDYSPPPAESKLGKVLSGVLKHPFLTADGARAMLSKTR